MPHYSKHKRHFPLADGVHKVNVEVADYHKRHGKAPCLQERGSVSDRFCVIDEEADNLFREYVHQSDAYARDDDYRFIGDGADLLHPRAVAGAVVVGDQRNHAEADADADVHRDAFNLKDDAH